MREEEGEEGGAIDWSSKCDCGCKGVKAECIHCGDDEAQSSVGSYDEDDSYYSEDSMETRATVEEEEEEDEGSRQEEEEEGSREEEEAEVSDNSEEIDSEEELLSNPVKEREVNRMPLAEQQKKMPSSEEVAKMVMTEGDLCRNQMVKNCLTTLRDAKQLTTRQLTRRMEKYLITATVIQTEEKSMDKPYSMLVRDMFREDMFVSGAEPLPEHEVKLKPDEFAKYHKLACSKCREADVIQKDCYFHKMSRCLTHGWKPTIEGGIQPAYSTRGNSPKVRLFEGSIVKEFEEMKRHGVVCRGDEGVGRPIISPLGVVIKTADLYRAVELAGTTIIDQRSLDQANERLMDQLLKRVKIRITTDVTQSGVNGAALTPPFRMSAPAEASMLIVRNGYLIKIDISRYYYMFVFAVESRFLFHFILFKVLWMYICVFFGFSAAPYHISTWSAEFQSWFNAMNLRSCHYMDDWLVSDRSEKRARKQEETIVAVFEAVGFTIQRDKTERGQQIVYLGVLYDTITMTLRFEPLQCHSMKVELERSLAQIRSDQQVAIGTIAHTCGKLAWYAECVQRGRLYSRSWWSLLKLRGTSPSPQLKTQLITQTKWWIDTLEVWSRGDCTGGEFPILSYSEMIAHPELVQLIQSDASGVDGYGYFFSTLAATESTFVAKRFPVGYKFVSSHGAELVALAAFMEADAARNCITIWLTDCLSAVWSVNKGRCFEENDLLVLDRILTAADNKKNQVIALWVPREINTLADYLSHLCNYCNREEVRGAIGGLASTAPAAGGAPSGSRSTGSDSSHSETVHKVVCDTTDSVVPTFVPSSSRFSYDKGGAVPRIDKISGQSQIAPKDPLQASSIPVDRRCRWNEGRTNRKIDAVRRSQPRK